MAFSLCIKLGAKEIFILYVVFGVNPRKGQGRVDEITAYKGSAQCLGDVFRLVGVLFFKSVVDTLPIIEARGFKL
ncbi:hypothetical protein NHP190003_04280 [Helicobacter sp. NHP19-003]|uniref:Uncharacterized protein n=1 Tax=Helicobacter gastrocanis TaxID=2849641 RepID=A0ABM7S9E4_9HELI|nr:hypothetical protein NHP190003_04280 [Helicobacter sp. NHP19-003]